MIYIFQDEEPVIEFYKARVGYFYSGLLDQVAFAALDLKISRQINQMIADKTNNVINNFMQNDRIPSYIPPMVSLGANIFQVGNNYLNYYHIWRRILTLGIVQKLPGQYETSR
jgi:capsule polysaccharide export protein KpsE/RkpR